MDHSMDDHLKTGNSEKYLVQLSLVVEKFVEDMTLTLTYYTITPEEMSKPPVPSRSEDRARYIIDHSQILIRVEIVSY